MEGASNRWYLWGTGFASPKDAGYGCAPRENHAHIVARSHKGPNPAQRHLNSNQNPTQRREARQRGASADPQQVAFDPGKVLGLLHIPRARKENEQRRHQHVVDESFRASGVSSLYGQQDCAGHAQDCEQAHRAQPDAKEELDVLGYLRAIRLRVSNRRHWLAAPRPRPKARRDGQGWLGRRA